MKNPLKSILIGLGFAVVSIIGLSGDRAADAILDRLIAIPVDMYLFGIGGLLAIIAMMSYLAKWSE